MQIKTESREIYIMEDNFSARRLVWNRYNEKEKEEHPFLVVFVSEEVKNVFINKALHSFLEPADIKIPYASSPKRGMYPLNILSRENCHGKISPKEKCLYLDNYKSSSNVFIGGKIV